jgi:hypothetical protein
VRHQPDPIQVTTTAGLSAGDTIDVDGEAREITKIGTAASVHFAHLRSWSRL